MGHKGRMRQALLPHGMHSGMGPSDMPGVSCTTVEQEAESVMNEAANNVPNISLFAVSVLELVAFEVAGWLE